MKRALAGLIGMALVSTASALLIDQPFDTVGPLPAGWANNNHWASVPADNTDNHVVVDIGGGDNRLQMVRLRDEPNFGDRTYANWVYFNGTMGDLRPGNALDDFEAQAVLRAFGTRDSQFRSIQFRAQTTAFQDALAYTATVYRTSGAGSVLRLYIDPVSHTSPGTELASTVMSEGFVLDTDYLLKVSAQGDQLWAGLYGLDGFGNFTVELATVSATDSTYASGYIGIRNAVQTNSAGTYWSDFEVIPEPGTLGLLLGVGGLALVRRRLRRRV